MNEQSRRGLWIIWLSLILAAGMLCLTGCFRAEVPKRFQQAARKGLESIPPLEDELPDMEEIELDSVMAVNGERKLSIAAKDAWVRLLPGDGKQIGTAYDDTYYSVDVEKQDGEIRIECTGKSVRNRKSQYIALKVPTDTFTELNLDFWDSMLTGEDVHAGSVGLDLDESAAAWLLNEDTEKLAIQMDNSALMLAEPDGFENANVRLQAKTSVMWIEEPLRSQFSRDGNIAILHHENAKTDVQVTAENSVLNINVEDIDVDHWIQMINQLMDTADGHFDRIDAGEIERFAEAIADSAAAHAESWADGLADRVDAAFNAARRDSSRRGSNSESPADVSRANPNPEAFFSNAEDLASSLAWAFY